jgi:hypothetical protein
MPISRESYYVVQKPIWHDPKVWWMLIKYGAVMLITGMVVQAAGCDNQTGSADSARPGPCRTLEVPALPK